MLFPNKITEERYIATLKEAKTKFSNRQIVVLYNTELPFENSINLNCNTTSKTDFAKRDFNNTIYIYACDADDIGAPFIETIINNNGKFLSALEATPSSYVHNNSIARSLLEKEFVSQKAGGFAKWDFGPHDFVDLIQAIDITSKLEGVFLEIGCLCGSSGCVALNYMGTRNIKRDCYFLDVFDGFNYEAAAQSADTHWEGTHQTEGLEIVRNRISKCGNLYGLNVIVEKRNIINEFPTGINQICLANIDVDLYEAVRSSLIKVAPLMVRGGIIVVEDAGHTPLLIGARVVLSQFLKTEIAENFIPIYMASGQTFLIRK